MSESTEGIMFGLEETPTKRPKIEEQGGGSSESDALHASTEQQIDPADTQDRKEFIAMSQECTLSHSSNETAQLTEIAAEPIFTPTEQNSAGGDDEFNAIIKQFCDALTSEQERIYFTLF